MKTLTHRKQIKLIHIFKALSKALCISVLLTHCATPPAISPTDESEADTLTPTSTQVRNSDQGTAFGLESVHFDFRSAALTPQAKAILKKNAAILKTHPQLILQIEGHCDLKGSIKVNLLVGKKRADAVRNFLIKEGVSPSNLSVISYGKSQPLDPEEGESHQFKNRRANFSVLTEG